MSGRYELPVGHPADRALEHKDRLRFSVTESMLAFDRRVFGDAFEVSASVWLLSASEGHTNRSFGVEGDIAIMATEDDIQFMRL